MKVYNVHDAKTHYSKLLKRVENGEEIILARAGKPIARMQPVDSPGDQPSRKVTGGGFRLQEKAGRPLTPEYLNKLAESKYE